MSTSPAQAPPLEAEVTLARTLDEATLRQLFPDAPAVLDVPRDVRSLFSARMSDLSQRHGTVGTVLVGAALVLAFLGWIAGMGPLAIGIAGALAVGAVALAAVQYSRAGTQFFASYARARGLQLDEQGGNGAKVPLFRRGDRREWPLLMRGPVAGQRATLGHFTAIDVSRDSEGNRREESHRFTFLHLTLPHAVASRYRGVYCRPRTISFGGLQDRVADDRSVQLESSEFAGRYSLRAADAQDDIALYELFSTSFVHRLATELEVYWEQCGTDLVVFANGHECEAADLDRMCLAGTLVLQRYLEEHR